jgi:hypothetical protein
MTEETPVPQPKTRKKKAERIKKDNASYYQRHKDEIKAARNKKYLEDPEFKERLLRKTREANARRAKERREMNKSSYASEESPSTFRVQLPDGMEIITEMVTIGQLSMFLEKQQQTIRMWEKKGYFPKAMYRNLKNNRLYTLFQVEAIVRFYRIAVSQFGKKLVENKLVSTNFFKRVHTLWIKYPYGVKEYEVVNGQDDED